MRICPSSQTPDLVAKDAKIGLETAASVGTSIFRNANHPASPPIPSVPRAPQEGLEIRHSWLQKACSSCPLV